MTQRRRHKKGVEEQEEDGDINSSSSTESVSSGTDSDANDDKRRRKNNKNTNNDDDDDESVQFRPRQRPRRANAGALLKQLLATGLDEEEEALLAAYDTANSDSSYEPSTDEETVDEVESDFSAEEVQGVLEGEVVETDATLRRDERKERILNRRRQQKRLEAFMNDGAVAGGIGIGRRREGHSSTLSDEEDDEDDDEEEDDEEGEGLGGGSDAREGGSDADSMQEAEKSSRNTKKNSSFRHRGSTAPKEEAEEEEPVRGRRGGKKKQPFDGASPSTGGATAAHPRRRQRPAPLIPLAQRLAEALERAAEVKRRVEEERLSKCEQIHSLQLSTGLSSAPASTSASGAEAPPRKRGRRRGRLPSGNDFFLPQPSSFSPAGSASALAATAPAMVCAPLCYPFSASACRPRLVPPPWQPATVSFANVVADAWRDIHRSGAVVSQHLFQSLAAAPRLHPYVEPPSPATLLLQKVGRSGGDGHKVTTASGAVGWTASIRPHAGNGPGVPRGVGVDAVGTGAVIAAPPLAISSLMDSRPLPRHGMPLPPPTRTTAALSLVGVGGPPVSATPQEDPSPSSEAEADPPKNRAGEPPAVAAFVCKKEEEEEEEEERGKPYATTKTDTCGGTYDTSTLKPSTIDSLSFPPAPLVRKRGRPPRERPPGGGGAAPPPPASAPVLDPPPLSSGEGTGSRPPQRRGRPPRGRPRLESVASAHSSGSSSTSSRESDWDECGDTWGWDGPGNRAPHPRGSRRRSRRRPSASHPIPSLEWRRRSGDVAGGAWERVRMSAAPFLYLEAEDGVIARQSYRAAFLYSCARVAQEQGQTGDTVAAPIPSLRAVAACAGDEQSSGARSFRWIHLHHHLLLSRSPGLLYPDANPHTHPSPRDLSNVSRGQPSGELKPSSLILEDPSRFPSSTATCTFGVHAPLSTRTEQQQQQKILCEGLIILLQHSTHAYDNRQTTPLIEAMNRNAVQATPPPDSAIHGMNAEATIQLNEQKEAEKAILQAQKVHIRVQQRLRKKNVTTVQGLNQQLNFRRLCREMQQMWGCNGSVINDQVAGKVIQLQGNLSEKLKEFLLSENMATPENLEIHSL
eukprot:gene7470-5265_t